MKEQLCDALFFVVRESRIHRHPMGVVIALVICTFLFALTLAEASEDEVSR